MSWLAEAATAVGTGGFSAIFSGVSGLVGGYLTKKINLETMKEENKHELAMSQEDAKQAEFELRATISIAKNKLDIALAEGEMEQEIIQTQGEADVARLDAEAFSKGLEQANKPTGHSGVDKFRALTRPLITWSLYLFVVVIFVVLHLKVGDLVAKDTALLVKLYVYLVQSIIYLFIMAVSWWFMSRGEKAVATIKGMFAK